MNKKGNYMRGKRILIGRNEVQIRTATENDVERLADLRMLQQHEDWNSEYNDFDNDFYGRTVRFLQNFLAIPCGSQAPYQGIMFVAEAQGRIIATCGLQFIRMMPQCNDIGEYGFIFNVFTQRGFRQRGIQSVLLEKVLAYAKDQNITEIKLETDNKIAIKMYEKCGFKDDTLSMIKKM